MFVFLLNVCVSLIIRCYEPSSSTVKYVGSLVSLNLTLPFSFLSNWLSTLKCCVPVCGDLFSRFSCTSDLPMLSLSTNPSVTVNRLQAGVYVGSLVSRFLLPQLTKFLQTEAKDFQISKTHPHFPKFLQTEAQESQETHW